MSRTESPEEVSGPRIRFNPEAAGAVGKWAGQLAGYAVATIAITFMLLRPSRSGKRGSLFFGGGVLVVLMKTLLSTGNATETNPVPAAPALASAIPAAPAVTTATATPKRSATPPPAVSITPKAAPVESRPVQPAPSPAKPAPVKAAPLKPKPAVPAPAAVAARKPAPPAAPLGARYSDKATGYSMQFPNGWTYKRSTDAGWLLEATDGQSAVINVGFTKFPATVTIDDVSAERVTQGLQKRPGTVVDSCGYSTIAGRRCLWHKLTGPMKRGGATVKVTSVHYFLPLQDGRALEVRLSAAPDRFKDVAPKMKQSVDTFKLLTRVADAG